MTVFVIGAAGITLTGVEQSRQLSAQVQDREGATVPNASVNWRSSDPETVQVTQDGLVTSLGHVGYAEITVEYQGSVSPPVPVAVVKLAQRSRILETTQVRSVSQHREEAVLTLDDVTGSLREGDIIINEAIFGRIVRLAVLDGEVRVRIDQVTVPEAFEAMVVRVRYREGRS